MSQKHLLFVYGTLLEGYRNHRVIEGSRFVDVAVTNDKFTMFTNGSYPAITVDPEYPIIGEIYEIDDITFENTDHLEGYNRERPDQGYYKRKQIKVTQMNSGKEETVWIYFLSESRHPAAYRGWRKMNVGDFSATHKKEVEFSR